MYKEKINVYHNNNYRVTLVCLGITLGFALRLLSTALQNHNNHKQINKNHNYLGFGAPHILDRK